MHTIQYSVQIVMIMLELLLCIYAKTNKLESYFIALKTLNSLDDDFNTN